MAQKALWPALSQLERVLYQRFTTVIQTPVNICPGFFVFRSMALKGVAMLFTALNFRRHISSRVGAVVAAVGGAAVLSGCVVAPMDDGYAGYGYTSTTVYTNYGYPPAPRVEYRTVAPSPYHVWVSGDWFWNGGRYDWRPGRWAQPGYRPAPPPRPPQVMPMPRPDRPMARPPEPRPDRPSVAYPEPRPQPPEARPDGGQRPPHMRPDQPRPPQQMRPDRGDRDQARPQPPQREERESRRPYRDPRDREDERRRP